MPRRLSIGDEHSDFISTLTHIIYSNLPAPLYAVVGAAGGAGGVPVLLLGDVGDVVGAVVVDIAGVGEPLGCVPDVLDDVTSKAS